MFFSEKSQIYSEAREEQNKHDFGICTADPAQAQKSIPLVLVHVEKKGWKWRSMTLWWITQGQGLTLLPQVVLQWKH